MNKRLLWRRALQRNYFGEGLMRFVLTIARLAEFAFGMQSIEGDASGKHRQASAKEKKSPEDNKRTVIEERRLA